MKLYSSVTVIIDKGATLHLKVSVVFGPIIVNGGIFTISRHAALTDTLILNDSNTLKDAQIISDNRYLIDVGRINPMF